MKGSSIEKGMLGKYGKREVGKQNIWFSEKDTENHIIIYLHEEKHIMHVFHCINIHIQF